VHANDDHSEAKCRASFLDGTERLARSVDIQTVEVGHRGRQVLGVWVSVALCTMARFRDNKEYAQQ